MVAAQSTVVAHSAFGKREVFRAAVFVELIGLAMDVRALEAVTNAAASRFDHQSDTQRVEGGSISHGGLVDAINGIAAGEKWFLKIWRVNPGLLDPEHIAAAFVKDGSAWENTQDNSIQKRQPSRAHVTVDLTSLFAPIIKLIGTV